MASLSRPRLTQPDQATGTYDMVSVRVDRRPLTATASLVWSCDLPRRLQQVLFDTADGIIAGAPAG